MRTRLEIEELENKILAPYAMKSRDSEGREYDNEAHAVRTCYQRDRDRIVHSEAFRKLENKTQVFVILEGDYYRNRLTHTIEVAQIARTIGRSLCLNEDLIEAIALAHDLGHPPFGHAGESALNSLMKEHGGFDHNYRSFEIVTELEKRYPGFPGLDLTAEVLVGILKHETVYDRSNEVKKYKDHGPTLEAKIVDVADALAYLSHDIDDGLTSGCISEEDLMESPLWQRVYKKVKESLKVQDKEMLKYQIVKFLIDCQIRDLLDQSNKNLQEKDFQSSREVRKYHLEYPKEILIAFSPKMRDERRFLQNLLQKKLYEHYRIIRMTDKARRIIEEIYHVYLNNPNQLPPEVYRRNKEDEQNKYQIICKYIASMTDRSALDEHKKLFNPYQKV